MISDLELYVPIICNVSEISHNVKRRTNHFRCTFVKFTVILFLLILTNDVSLTSLIYKLSEKYRALYIFADCLFNYFS